jgi:hypothetical protein
VVSPYLLRPLRTLRQVCREISMSHPQSMPPDCSAYADADTCDADYTLAIKNKGRPPRSWRWEIYAVGKNKPVGRSEFFETMSEATRTGKAALAKFRSNRAG